MSRLFSLVIDKEMIEHIPFNKFNIDKNKLKFMFFCRDSDDGSEATRNISIHSKRNGIVLFLLLFSRPFRGNSTIA